MNPSEIGELLLGNISAIQSLGLSPDRVTELEQDAYAVVRNVAQASTNTTAIKIVDLIGSYFKLDVAAELVLAPTADLAAEVECCCCCRRLLLRLFCFKSRGMLLQMFVAAPRTPIREAAEQWNGECSSYRDGAAAKAAEAEAAANS